MSSLNQFWDKVQYCAFSAIIHSPALRSSAFHLAQQSPFHGLPGHISSRDGIDLCPSSTANPSRQRSRAHRLARCFAGRPPEGHLTDTDLPHKAVTARLVPGPTLSCNSSDKAIAIPRASRARPLARWHRFVSIERREPLQTALQGTSAHAMICWDNTERLDVLQEDRRNCHGPATQGRQSPVSAQTLKFLQFI